MSRRSENSGKLRAGQLLCVVSGAGDKAQDSTGNLEGVRWEKETEGRPAPAKRVGIIGYQLLDKRRDCLTEKL